MDFATLLGLFAGVIVIAGAVASSSDMGSFVNLPGVLIVVGGTTAAVLVKFPLKNCIDAFAGGLKVAFIEGQERPEELIKQATFLSAIARKKGKLALESAVIKSRFFKKGAQLIADGHSPEFIRKLLTMEMDNSIERHQLSERVFRAIGDSAPAFGMIGTLVGLVQMLTKMDDPAMLGSGMAVALLTTLYGSVIANLFAIPLADKLLMRAQEEYLSKALIIESIICIDEGQNPKVMEELLATYLPGHQRAAMLGEHHSIRPVTPE